MIGSLFKHYEVIERIGAGGMGVVYRAHDRKLERDVALKVLASDTLRSEEARRQFRREALALSRLNHPNIAVVHDFDTVDDVDFIIMELIEGHTLHERMRQGPMAVAEIVQIAEQMLDGLAAAHERGIIHRDIKPANLRFTKDGRLKLIDFGLAKRTVMPYDETAPNSEHLDESMAGTLAYMAPEQLRTGELDARSDIYSCGSVIYEMATGRQPFYYPHTVRMITAILEEEPQRPALARGEVGGWLEAVIVKAMAKKPAQRYQTALEMKSAFQGAEAHERSAMRSRTSSRSQTVRRSAKPKRARSIVVLPLENLSRDPEQDYFADGLTESLITDVSKIPELKVISRTTSMRYKDSRKTLPEIARELDVDVVLTGSVVRSQERMRIHVQLIDAASDQHLWAESYERPFEDVFMIQAEVASAIAAQLEIKLTPTQKGRLAVARPVNAAAHEAYLRGRQCWNRRTKDDFKRAIGYFQEAIENDPAHVLAYAGLADCYVLLGAGEYCILPPKMAMPRAKAAAKKALEIDSNSAEALAALGSVQFRFEWNSAAAERTFREALKLNPSYATARYYFAVHLLTSGRFEEALEEINRAVELDPLAAIYNAMVSYVLYNATRYEEAELHLRACLEVEPNFAVSHFIHTCILVELGRFEEAVTAMERAIELAGPMPHWRGSLAVAHALAGRTEKAREILAQLELDAKTQYVQPVTFALIYNALGEGDKACEQLEAAYEDRDGWLIYARVTPLFANLRTSERFQKLIARMQDSGFSATSLLSRSQLLPHS
ncbi:MAG: protein kinase [Acidobacteriaceae bacterium]